MDLTARPRACAPRGGADAWWRRSDRYGIEGDDIAAVTHHYTHPIDGQPVARGDDDPAYDDDVTELATDGMGGTTSTDASSEGTE